MDSVSLSSTILSQGEVGLKAGKDGISQSPGVEARPKDCPAREEEGQQGNWTRGHWSELAKPPRSSKWKGEEARMI